MALFEEIADMIEKLVPGLDFTPPALRDVSLKVAKVNGINLGQGVCQMPVPQAVILGAQDAMRDGANLYSPSHGVQALRETIAGKLASFNGIDCGPENIVVTTGATGAFEAVCHAFLSKGDEIVNFIPFYPYHRNPLVKKGVGIRYVELTRPDWRFDMRSLERAIGPRTKMILVNTPNNPTGKVFSREELEGIAEICRERGLLCVTDEVYEYMTYDGRRHVSIASLPGMRDLTITIGSYSKTFSITGWRIGYLCAPLDVVDALKSIFDQIYVCAPTPLQHGVLRGLRELDGDYYDGMLADYQRKREIMRRGLDAAGLAPIVPEGAYYMIADTSLRFPGLTSGQAVEIMIEQAGVGAVPASDFLGPEVKDDPARSNFLRFCYALPDDRLEEAARRLAKL